MNSKNDKANMFNWLVRTGIKQVIVRCGMDEVDCYAHLAETDGAGHYEIIMIGSWEDGIYGWYKKSGKWTYLNPLGKYTGIDSFYKLLYNDYKEHELKII